MDFKEMQQQLSQLRTAEDVKTVAFIQENFDSHLRVFDLSNKFVFEQACGELIARLKSHYRKGNTLRAIALQNVMMETEQLNAVLRGLLEVKKPLALRVLDIGNNRIELTEETADLLARTLSKRMNPHAKTLILQGNPLQNPRVITALFTHEPNFLELNLYDTRLSSAALVALSEALGRNVRVKRLDLGYNADAFLSEEAVEALGIGIARNSKLEYVNLCGNEPLHKTKMLTGLLTGLETSRTLESLGLGGLNLGDKGSALLISHLRSAGCLCSLDIHNNGIGTPGFLAILADLPTCLSTLDISYNQIKDQRTVLALARCIQDTRSLRSLNISHAIEIEEMSYKVKQTLAEAIKANDSLTEFYCEGAKIGDDPDDFCEVLGQAISERRLSLTFKISAVNCFQSNSSQLSSYQSASSHSSQISREKIVSIIPSEVVSPQLPHQVNSTLQTERRNCEAESREASLSATPREYCFSGSSPDKSTHNPSV